jgi:hypothetical protein
MFKFSRLKTALTVVLLLAVSVAQYRTTIGAAVNAGLIRVSASGTGASSGGSIILEVEKTARAGSGSLDISVPPGTRLASSDPSAQNMVIAGVAARFNGTSWEQTSRIFISDRALGPAIRESRRGNVFPVALSRNTSGNASTAAQSSGIYLLEAYCTDFEKDNPSESTGFSLGGVDSNLACILNNAASIQVKQAAVWIYTDRATYSHLTQKFPLTGTEWQEARNIIARCGLN